MLSNQIIQECIDDISQIMHVPLCIFEANGAVAADNLSADEELRGMVDAFLESSADSQQVQGYCFFKLYDDEEVSYIVVADCGHTGGESAGRLAVSQIGRLMEAYKEKFSRNQFIQNLLLDNLVGADIYNQSKLLGMEASALRMVFLLETEHEGDDAVMEMIRELYGKNSHDFITAIDDRNIIFVRELREKNAEEEMVSIANMLVDMVNVETMSKVRVGYGNPAADIKEVSRSYREAKMALEVGEIFYSDKNIVAYNMLGIGRLIYQLPKELCDMFLDEVFGGEVPKKLDEETLATVNKFFEMNLNLSETARHLYVHRNTLAYRLEKVEKLTGLDVRSFEDAMTFKLALMVADYRRWGSVKK